MRQDSTTLSEQGQRRASVPPSRGLAFLVAWCPARPDVVGAVAFLDPEPRFVGRAVGSRDDLDPLRFVRQRPGRNGPVRPLDLAAISRVQLIVQTLDDHRVALENVGKCKLFIGGAQVDRVELTAGRTARLGEQILLQVVDRPDVFPPLVHWDEDEFAFGEPDALDMIGEGERAWRLRDVIAHAAASADHLLVRGQSGVGKELVAQGVHRLSARRGRSFVARNAATIPESLMAAELFGNRRGYPNPSSPERGGLVGAADHGTLFLDEIGELPHALQAALLRVMDPGGSYQRLGESEARESDLRIVGATNRPLDALKPDLRARFELGIHVPPLDERRDDIPLLIRHLVRDWGVELGFELVERLLLHDYDLNVRELRALLLNARATGRDPLEPPEELLAAPATTPTSEIDEARLRDALRRHEGVVARVWRELGLKNRYVLRRLLAKHGIDPADYRG